MCLCCVFTDIASYYLLRQRFHLMLWLYLQQLLWEVIQSVQEQMMPKYLMALSHFLASQGLWGKRCICRRLGQWLDGTCWSIGVFCSFFKIYSSWWWRSSRIERGKINILPWTNPSFFSSVGNAYWYWFKVVKMLHFLPKFIGRSRTVWLGGESKLYLHGYYCLCCLICKYTLLYPVVWLVCGRNYVKFLNIIMSWNVNKYVKSKL